MINITDMTIDDFDLIEPTLLSDFDSFWKPNTFKSELLNENSKYIIAKKATGEILGFGGVWKSVDDIHITNIVVKKDLRNQGIGSLLLKRLIEISKEYNFESITLEVKYTNFSAIELYSKHGFKEVGKRKKYYNGTEDALIMTLNLKN